MAVVMVASSLWMFVAGLFGESEANIWFVVGGGWLWSNFVAPYLGFEQGIRRMGRALGGISWRHEKPVDEKTEPSVPEFAFQRLIAEIVRSAPAGSTLSGPEFSE
jgi:hypothetical protein